MSHIATHRQVPCPTGSHYSGQAFAIAQFYTLPMALRIKELRKAKGLTQVELAQLAGMTRSHLNMIENETRPANTLRLNAIAAALGVQPDELFDVGEGEGAILSLLRQLGPDDRAAIVRMAEALAAKAARD